MMVRNPTADAIKRWVCSKKIPPIHFETGNKNMLYPKVVGQSGTARPTPLLVTIPPLQMSRTVAAAVNQAKRWRKGFVSAVGVRIGSWADSGATPVPFLIRRPGLLSSEPREVAPC